MKKFMNKLVSISLTSLMVVSLVACGGQSTTTPSEGGTATTESTENTQSNAPAEKTVIGGIGSSLVSSFEAALINSNEIAKTYGIEFVSSELAGYDDQAFLTMYENMIDQGANALIVYTFSESALKLVADLCVERNVNFFIANRQITDPALKDYVYGLPNFLGTCFCDETQIAYDLVKEMAEDYGVKNLAVIGLQQGDINGDYRDTGINKACEDFGVNLLTETRGVTTVEDVTNAVEGMIASYPEMDGIFIVGGAVTPGALAGANQALANHGLEDKVSICLIDIENGMEQYMGEGKALKVCAGGNLSLDMILPMIWIANHAQGYHLDEEPVVLNTRMQLLRSAQDVVDFGEYCENTKTPIYTGNGWDAVVGKSAKEIQEWVNNFNPESVKASR